MSKRLRVGIIGVGLAGRARARAVREHAELELIGAYRGRFIEELELRAFPSVDALLESVDAVIIASPNPTHPLLIRRALQAGLHVCVEFPAVTPGPSAVGELEELLALAERSSRTLHVEHIELLSGVASTLKSHLRGERIRQLVCRFTRRTPSDTSHTLGAAALPRLHRIAALTGPFTSIESVTLQPNRLAATLTSERCDHVELTIQQSPSLPRALHLDLETESGRPLRVEGRSVFVEGAEVPVQATAPLFAIDLDAFVRRVKGGAGYVSNERLLHILDASSRLSACKVGPLPS